MATGNDRSGRRAPLSREQVVAAAVELADEAGLEGLTMRKLADRVGLKPMSLYHHVADKDDLLDGMVDVVFSEIELPHSSDWKTAMRLRAISARKALGRHPWAIGLMESRTRPGQANLRHHDAVLGILQQAGFTIVSATQAYSILDSYIYGFALQEASLPFGSADELDQVAEAIVMLMPPDEYPNLRKAATELAASGYDYSDQFELGLDMILDGLEQLHIPN
ncbi:MAG: TetR/AcrR family transcriptional regulator C-terminal domain-containing protein [Actinomycetota bacterium]|nr:TetR/AcrR family transcriptional regulator C-terminal domain-containing protein [Actinomycetota bacterium]